MTDELDREIQEALRTWKRDPRLSPELHRKAVESLVRERYRKREAAEAEAAEVAGYMDDAERLGRPITAAAVRRAIARRKEQEEAATAGLVVGIGKPDSNPAPLPGKVGRPPWRRAEFDVAWRAAGGPVAPPYSYADIAPRFRQKDGTLGVDVDYLRRKRRERDRPLGTEGAMPE